MKTVRVPTHTIQFMRYGYREYVKQVLESAGQSSLESLKELKKYENWTPYRTKDRV
jgi:hypothetical protein